MTSGVAVIMQLAEYAMKSHQWKHGPIRLLFTPDEEIGRGVDAINMDKVNAAFGYTLDGGQKGDSQKAKFFCRLVSVVLWGKCTSWIY